MTFIELKKIKNRLNTFNREARIDELEKIKKKIENDCILHEGWFVNLNELEKYLLRIYEIIDREIIELKGE